MSDVTTAAPAYRILGALAEGTAAATGDEFFRSLARHAALALGARYAFVAESLSEMESRSLAYWEGTGFGEGFSYRFPGTPCQRVAAGHICSTTTDLQRLFPEDIWLQQIGVDSYVGVPMKTAEGKVLGHIAVLHTEPLTPSPEDIAALRVFASRGCAELARVQADRALRVALAEVERLKERLQAENLYLQEEIRSEHNFEEIVGKSETLVALLEQVAAVADTDAAVLIEGETGTGKELIARALHGRSSRRDRPLVKVNCGALSAGLVESELFGHERGAFTGAFQRRVGRFELANGGTLFLDEVGELPLDTQVKLLRVLQEKEFEPVGSSETRTVDARVIAATNRNLVEAVREGRFRADLYYRLNVVPLRVPPLRERREDIAPLAMYLLARAARKTGKAVHGIATHTLAQLEGYDFPGNIRELENIIERAVVLSPGPVLAIDLGLPAGAKDERGSERPEGPRKSDGRSVRPSAPQRAATEPGVTEDEERRQLLAALERTSWVIEGAEGAARLLNLNPSTARSRMKKLGISRTVKPE